MSLNPPPATVIEPRPEFVRLAWASLLLGIIGVTFAAVPILNIFTLLGALVGILLGAIALFGPQKPLAGAGTVLCVLAMVLTMNSLTAAVDEPVDTAPPLVTPRAPVEPSAALPAPAPQVPPVPVAPIPPTTAARQATPTTPAERVETSTDQTVVKPPPVAPQPVAPQRDNDSSSGGGATYYKNCDAARAAGAAPIMRGESGYRPALDRDNDGIACE